MILTKEIKIKITDQNISYYENLGYEVSLGANLEIPVELLTSGSHHKILCKCDKCGIEKQVIYKNYVNYDNNWGEYNCRKCSESKRKNSLKKSLGVEYPVQNKLVRERIIQKNRKNYQKVELDSN